MNIKRKVFTRASIILIILGALFLHFYIPRLITEINNPLAEIIRGKHATTAKPSFEGFEDNKAKGKYITFQSFDNITVSSYITYAESGDAKGTIILLHGIRSNKESFISLSKKLSKLGYNTIAIDSRAHGTSGGTHCTFGVKEKKDVAKLIDILEKEEQITQNIGVWGKSLGGAIGLQSMSYDKRIKFGIIESTFSDFKTITNDYFKYHLGFNIKPLTNYLVYRAGKIADFNPSEATPIKYCEKINQPMLLVHGSKDKRININYAKANFEHLISKEKQFIEIESANHLNVWHVGGDEYFNQAISFIEKNTARNIVNH